MLLHTRAVSCHCLASNASCDKMHATTHGCATRPRPLAQFTPPSQHVVTSRLVSLQMVGVDAAPAVAYACELFIGWLTARAWQFTARDGRHPAPLLS